MKQLTTRLVRIETKVSKMMQYLNVPVNDRDDNDLLSEAYDLLCDFEDTVNKALEGDHPQARQLTQWLTRYEKLKGLTS